jgi:hypothetical protein
MTLSETLISTLIRLFGSGWTMAEGGAATPRGAETERGSAQTLPDFSQVDVDQNLSISPTEAQAVPGLVEAFAQVDTNQRRCAKPGRIHSNTGGFGGRD